MFKTTVKASNILFFLVLEYVIHTKIIDYQTMYHIISKTFWNSFFIYFTEVIRTCSTYMKP